MAAKPAPVTVRSTVMAALKPLLPKSWALFEYNTNLDEITVPTVVLSFERYERSKVAPRAIRSATFVLTIVQPMIHPGPADDALDADVIDLLNALDDIAEGVATVVWTTAVRGVAFGRPGFDITLTVPNIQINQEA